MTSTPRLDSLKTNGTNGDFEGIRLADGHMLSVKTHAAGFAWLQEVFLFPGLTAPDTEAWSNDDPYEVWLTGGDLGEKGGSLYYGVPVEAVRELIVQHGGEHDNQEPPAPAVEGETGEGAAPNPLARIAHLHGRFADGYTPDAIRSVFGRIYDEGGPYLVCVWEYADAYGFGGNSEFYAEGEDGELFEVTPYVHQWLSGQRETPGPLDTWVCAPVTEPTDLPVSDDFHNYARADRTAD